MGCPVKTPFVRETASVFSTLLNSKNFLTSFRQLSGSFRMTVSQTDCLRLHWGLLFVLVVGLATPLWGCEYRSRSGQSLPSDSLQTEGPSQITRDAVYSVNEDGRPRARIQAARMEQYRSDDSTYSVWRTLSDTGRVRSYIFEEGDSSATITADSVVYYAAEGEFDAYGNVLVRTNENRRLESEHLTWHQFDRTIRTRRFVHITTPSEDVRGNGLVADEDLETYQIGEFTAEVEVEE